MSYARYLYAVSSGKVVPVIYDVDHKDGDCTNDTYENLQLLTKAQNSKKSAADPRSLKRSRIYVMECPVCDKNFNLTYSKTFMATGGKFNACSRDHANICLRDGLVGIEGHKLKHACSTVSVNTAVPWNSVSSEIINTGYRIRCICGKLIDVKPSRSKSQKYCSIKCRIVGAKSDTPEIIKLSKIYVKKNGTVNCSEVGRILGISSNTVKKHLGKTKGA
jgi:hypothetical protein